MNSYAFLKGSTSKRLQVFVENILTGEGLTGLAHDTSDLVAYYFRDGAVAPTEISLVDGTVGTYASSGFKEIDATNLAGWYELGVPNAVLADGADSARIVLGGAANMRQCNVQISLVAYNAQDGAGLGLTNLDATVGSRSTLTAADVWASGSRTLTSVSGLGLATAAKLLKFVQLIARSDAAIATDNATELSEINADGGSGSGDYSNANDAQEALRDRLDSGLAAASVPSSTDRTDDYGTISYYIGETISLSLTTSFDLSGRTLEVAIDDATKTEVFTTTSVSVSGDSNEIATFTPDATIGASEQVLTISLRDTDDGDRVLGTGRIDVKYAALADE